MVSQNFSGPQGNDNAAAPQFIAFVRPPSHHADALVPKIRTRIGASHTVIVDMRKLALDGIGVP